MNEHTPPTLATNTGLRTAVIWVALANLAYFLVEYTYAMEMDSVSLFADSIDFLEDASVNLLIVLALAWSIKKRSLMGMGLAVIVMVPGLSVFWAAWQKFQHPVPPDPWLLSAVGLGALVVNVACAWLLARFRHHGGSLTRAAFLSARNDAFANLAIMGAGVLTAAWPSGWPDLIVGLAIAVMNADAAREILEAARDEYTEAHS
ncbi:MAG: cation transporter [Methylococcaceae bacterium]